jgi:hypothetical protein
MNKEMWAKAAVQHVGGFARTLPHHRSARRWQSCRERGVGRMAEPATIAAKIREMLDVTVIPRSAEESGRTPRQTSG